MIVRDFFYGLIVLQRFSGTELAMVYLVIMALSLQAGGWIR